MSTPGGAGRPACPARTPAIATLLEENVIEAQVTVTGNHTYPARIIPGQTWNGWLVPYFTLEIVRQIAAETQAAAERYGHKCVDTVHVIDGGTDEAGQPRAVVVQVSWRYLDQDGPESVTSVAAPNEDGLYCVGGWEWTWYRVDAPAGEQESRPQR